MRAPVDVVGAMAAAGRILCNDFNHDDESIALLEARGAVAKLIKAAREVMACPELAEIACTGSMAPCEDALGQLQDALARLSPPLTREQLAQGNEAAARA